MVNDLQPSDVWGHLRVWTIGACYGCLPSLGHLQPLRLCVVGLRRGDGGTSPGTGITGRSSWGCNTLQLVASTSPALLFQSPGALVTSTKKIRVSQFRKEDPVTSVFTVSSYVSHWFLHDWYGDGITSSTVCPASVPAPTASDDPGNVRDPVRWLTTWPWSFPATRPACRTSCRTWPMSHSKAGGGTRWTEV